MLGILSIQAGQLIGSTLGAAIASTDPTPFDMAMLAAFFIFVILISSLFAIDKTPSSYGWDLVKPEKTTILRKNSTKYARSLRNAASCHLANARSFSCSPKAGTVLTFAAS